MEPELEKNIRISESDRPLNAPVLSIEIAPNLTHSIDDPLGFIVTVRREEDGINKPCIFRWDIDHDAWGPSGFLLFQHTSDGLKKIEGNRDPPPPETLEYTQNDVCFAELLPGQCLRRNIGNPIPFRDQLVAGEKYELLWPGAEYALWDWGTLREHIGHKVGVGMGEPRAIIPGGAISSITVKQGANVWKPTAPSPIRQFSRPPGTPCLSVTLEGPSEMVLGKSIPVTMKVTYNGLANEHGEAVLAGSKPLIIQSLSFSFSNFNFHRRCHDYDQGDSDDDDPEWEVYVDDDWNNLYYLPDGSDIEVNVTDEEFWCLQPGESRTDQFTCSELHEETAIGDSYRIQYWGGSVKWWILGSREEHADTTVKVNYMNDVVDPVDNEGKPEITIPGSNHVEFIIVDREDP